MFPNKTTSPIAILDAIMAYTEADGSFTDIATALNLEPKGFSRLMDWYVTQLPPPDREDHSSPQTLVWIILFQMLTVERKKVKDLTEKLERLSLRVTRLHTPLSH